MIENILGTSYLGKCNMIITLTALKPSKELK